MTPQAETQPLNAVAVLLSAARGRIEKDTPGRPALLSEVRRDLEAAQTEAEGFGRPDLADALRRLAIMTEVWECLALEGTEAAREVAEFSLKALDRLADDACSGVGDPSWVVQESAVRWGDYLELLDPIPTNPPEATVEAGEPLPEEAPAIDPATLLRMLAGAASDVSGEESSAPLSPQRGVESEGDPPTCRAHSRHDPHPDPLPLGEGRGEGDIILVPAEQLRPAGQGAFPEAAPALTLNLDPELCDAFLAEASDLFERIEELVVNLPRAPDPAQSLHELGRCFHTLKGAAGSVGLAGLAARVHALEDEIEGASALLPSGLLDLLHWSLADFEATLLALRQGPKPKSREPAPDAESPSAMPRGEGPAGGPIATETSLRIPATRIDELLDLVSELIARRGVWTAQAEAMNSLIATARACRSRLTASIDRLRDLGPGPKGELAGLTRDLAEQAEDIAVLIQAAQEAIGPVTDEGDAFARISLQLWEALQAIQIVPMRGLFNRLARVARDAARVEGRQVEVDMVGEENGLDRAIQDKAFEPLLHVVRNAVGHGIEPAAVRVEAGKPPVGRVTLEARREGSALVLAVHDDGRGLDYAAIEAKGRRLGLIGPDEVPGTGRLNALVFQSGFSTRPEANAISGRGVGMDVVAQEVARMRGTVDLVSQPGRGTTLTVRLPTRLSLERAMVVRIDGQAFALPVESIEHAQPLDPDDRDGSGAAGVVRVRGRPVPLVDARRALGISVTPPASCSKLLLVRADRVSSAVLVDAIDGPRELVLKPLGPLLAGHPVIAGTSVSVTGEVVLAVNPSGLACRPGDGESPPGVRPGWATPDRENAVLVVDDSISVRRVAARHLHALGFEVDEVCDGLEALRKLRTRRYRMVLTDLEMPRMDGFELLAELGRQGALAATPVVVTSTRSDPETWGRARELGAGAFVAKPFDAAELARAVEGLGLGAARGGRSWKRDNDGKPVDPGH